MGPPGRGFLVRSAGLGLCPLPAVNRLAEGLRILATLDLRYLPEGRPGAQPYAYASLTYTLLMAMTTIRVEAEVRDRLAARAAVHGRGLGAELRAMLDEMMWQGIEAGYRRLATHQEEMAAYQAEAAGWTSTGLGDLAATAAEEYPEYNP
jgi:plasmid stability protein